MKIQTSIFIDCGLTCAAGRDGAWYGYVRISGPDVVHRPGDELVQHVPGMVYDPETWWLRSYPCLSREAAEAAARAIAVSQAPALTPARPERAVMAGERTECARRAADREAR